MLFAFEKVGDGQRNINKEVETPNMNLLLRVFQCREKVKMFSFMDSIGTQ